MQLATILVVERDAEVLRVLRKILERANFAVLTARTGQQALSIYARHRERIDLLVIDGDPPEIRCLRTEPDVKVVGLGDTGCETACAPVLEKPFRPDELLTAVRTTLSEQFA